jgi:hypothetical protein
MSTEMKSVQKAGPLLIPERFLRLFFVRSPLCVSLRTAGGFRGFRGYRGARCLVAPEVGVSVAVFSSIEKTKTTLD